MVVHAIACKICSAKCDEHSGRVCSTCSKRIADLKANPEKFRLREISPLRTESEKHRTEVENL